MKYIRFLLLCAFFTLAALPARAQVIIRDAEIENYMAEWFKPIFEAAQMDPTQVKIILVQSPDVNAFVAGGSNIFFYTGLIDKTDGPEELIGVMAHELGHIAGGHLVRAREAMEHASYETILGTIIGIGAALATGDGGAAGAIGMGTGSMAQRKFLSTARTYEASADQYALDKLERAEMSGKGLLSFMRKLEDQEALPASRQSEYVRTHPLTRTRVDSIAAGAAKEPHYNTPVPEKWIEQHKRMKAKLTGYISPQQVQWVYDDKDKSVAAQSARAVAAYRQNHVPEALALADWLIAAEPDNPYHYELKGQMLTDFGRVKDAIPVYQKAVDLLPKSGLIRTALAHAQIEAAGQHNEVLLKKAITNLETALQEEPRAARIHRLLATAYGRLGQDGQARLHLAEEALLQQKIPYAKSQAEAALQELPEGSRDRLKAKDILLYIQNNPKTGKR